MDEQAVLSSERGTTIRDTSKGGREDEGSDREAVAKAGGVKRNEHSFAESVANVQRKLGKRMYRGGGAFWEMKLTSDLVKNCLGNRMSYLQGAGW